MLQRHRSKTLVIGLALAVATLVAACNPTNETRHTPPSGGSVTTQYIYRGADPGWLQVRVASSNATAVKALARVTGFSHYCLGDGAFGVDTFVTCDGQTWGVTSSWRWAMTEGQARGWKKLVSISPEQQFRIDVDTVPGDRDVKLEIAVVDGDGNPIGDLVPLETSNI